ncbi:HNH endonuclease, partial [Arhodomonas aquaeolei]|uniref:HNH endonuclease n=1 Tax=Arhodomonas aquaeolei TaxID=2369 RepID=UPI001FDF2181
MSDVLDKCISSIRDTDLRKRLSLVSSDIDAAEADYDHKGTCKVLYSISQKICDDGQAVLGAVTKKELKDVYSLHMVPNGKPAREFYEKLLFGAPRGRCPLCGHGQASTLDHYLPKSRYPQLAVVPLNLVPCCKDCNTGKGERFSSDSRT